MTDLAGQLAKPHFIFRPRQMVTRLRELRPAGDPQRQVALPWGARIDCLRNESIGSSLARTGVYDLPVTEALARLVDPGEVLVDAGANIGYMSSLMAWRAGPGGRVLSFEPNPEIVPVLDQNVERWRSQAGFAPITVFPVALSDQDGTASLRATAGFERNMGTASLAEHSPGRWAHAWEVATRRLDEHIQDGPVGVLKIDVEDHELQVLRGAQRAISEDRIRDILLEDRTGGESPSLDFLRRRGYGIFAIEHGFLGLTAASTQEAAIRASYDPPTFLATSEPARAIARLAGRGWTSLNPRLFARWPA